MNPTDDRRTRAALDAFWNPPDFVLRQAGADATAGLDMAGSEPQAFRTEVLCPAGRSVEENYQCPNGCRPGQCRGCPANEEA